MEESSNNESHQEEEGWIKVNKSLKATKFKRKGKEMETKKIKEIKKTNKETQKKIINNNFIDDGNISEKTSEIEEVLKLISLRDTDRGMISLGIDFTNLHLLYNENEPNVVKSFIMPWDETEDKIGLFIPKYYLITKPPMIQTKLSRLSELSLFFLFYLNKSEDPDGNPVHDIISHELYRRGWRWHLDIMHWIYKIKGPEENNLINPQRGIYTIFDPDSWSKFSKELEIYPKMILKLDDDKIS